LKKRLPLDSLLHSPSSIRNPAKTLLKLARSKDIVRARVSRNISSNPRSPVPGTRAFLSLSPGQRSEHHLREAPLRTCPSALSHIACIVEILKQTSNHHMSTPAKPLTSDAQRIFEAALTVVDSDDSRSRTAAAALLERTRPLRSRTESPRIQKERALNDAAEALARLWKRQ
jgi:hypothetical protein